jgi:hypothetical protein
MIYDVQAGTIDFMVNGEEERTIEIRDFAEGIARNMWHPVNPLTCETMKKGDLEFLQKELWPEICMIRFYLVECEYPWAGHEMKTSLDINSEKVLVIKRKVEKMIKRRS